MKVLVIGTGGREHALVHALLRDPEVSAVHAAPGNAGIAADVPTYPVEAGDGDAVAELATRLAVDLVVIGPEAPLVAGVADAVRAKNIACFGPSKRAALLEGSKAFAKEVMAAAGVPTAMAVVCDTKDEAAAALARFEPPYVVKDDGLAAGKGVVVTSDYAAALAHAESCGRVVVEEHLDGPEVSLFCVTDGETAYPLMPAQDFKRAYDDDDGPNTGGMGAYAPLPWAPDDLTTSVLDRVVQPTINEMRARGIAFSGLLYAGLALTTRGLRVVEFNARFGDPETQALLPLLRSGVGGLLMAAATGRLAYHPAPVWHSGSSVTVVVAAHGYPHAPRKGDPIIGLDAANAVEGVEVAHAGTRIDSAGELVSSGGRVLAVTALGDDLAKARERAYEAADLIQLDGGFHRGDIASAAARGKVSFAGTV